MLHSKNTLVNYTSSLLLIVLIGYLLIEGRGIFIPMVMAILIWHLLNSLFNCIKQIPLVGKYLPNTVVIILAMGISLIVLLLLGNIIGNNINEVIQASSRYQESLVGIFAKIDQRFDIKVLVNLEGFIKSLSLQRVVMNVYAMFTAVMSSALLIALYVAFLFVEQHFFSQKLEVLLPNGKHRELVNRILSQLVQDTQRYLSLKTFVSALTAVSSFLIMKAVGLDFSEFWALLIFFLNFIPNIGSIIATVFPAFLALIQFESWIPFIIITTGILFVEFIIGNIIEPRLMGRSLNVSPLVILIALALWGAIWGIIGMVLSVPITVMMMIIFSHFEKTRPIAILLSQDGQLKW